MVNVGYIKEFGLAIFLVNALSRILRKLNFHNKILWAVDRFKHRVDEKWLCRRFGYLIQNDNPDLNIIKRGGQNRHTFVFWWQGLATAPDIVRLCVKSIENNVDNLIVLDKKNYTQWVSLPSYIIDRLECGEMSLAHFSDIVRFYLLFVYGGVWLDATCFLSRRIPQDILHKDFWCINGAFKNNYGWKWTSFVMIGKAGNIVSKQMLSFYYEYWKVHHYAITYLFLDCWLTVLYERNKRIMDIINSLPDNGYKVFFLISNLNREYVPELEDKIRNTFFVYKLTYKEPFYIEANEKLSLYGYLLRSNGILH